MKMNKVKKFNNMRTLSNRVMLKATVMKFSIQKFILVNKVNHFKFKSLNFLRPRWMIRTCPSLTKRSTIKLLLTITSPNQWVNTTLMSFLTMKALLLHHQKTRPVKIKNHFHSLKTKITKKRNKFPLNIKRLTNHQTCQPPTSPCRFMRQPRLAWSNRITRFPWLPRS